KLERALVPEAELVAVTERLLDVVADELVTGLVRLEPAGSALMQLRPALLRQAGVRRVADQNVAAAKAGVGGRRLPVGLDQVLAHEPEQDRPEPAALLAIQELGNGTPAELLPDHRGAL